MRPVITIRATRTDVDEVFLQFSNPLLNFGSLVMTLGIYKAFRDTLTTGSFVCAKDVGCSFNITESDFDQWGPKNA